MNSKTLIWILALLLLCSFASAITTDGLISYWDMDNGANDVWGENDPITSGCDPPNTNGALLNSTRCATAKITYNMSKVNIPARSSFTQIIWVNWTTTPVDTGIAGIWSMGDSAVTFYGADYNNSNIYWNRDIADDPILVYYGETASGATTSTFSTINTGTWYMIAVVYDGTTLNLFSNEAGTFQINGNATKDNILIDRTGIFYLGGRGDGNTAQLQVANFDEVSLWNRSLTNAELTEIYNGGIPLPFSSYEGVSGAISFLYPNGTYNDTYNDYNGSILVSTSVYSNCTTDNANWTLQEFNNTDFAFYNSNTLSEGNHSVMVICNSTPDNIFNSTVTFVTDTILPVITTSSWLSSNKYVVFNNALNGTVTCTDEHLYFMNISIDDSITLFNKSNIEANNQSYNISYLVNYSLYTGVHYLNVLCKDGHTLAKIPDFTYEKSFDDSITYRFNKDWIKIKPIGTIFQSSDTWKEDDRYIIEYKRDAITKLLYGSTMEFEVTSSKKLEISSKEDYRGWIISNALDKWIDFESDYEDAIVTSRIDKDKIIIKVENIDADTIQFKSIGSLNVVNESYAFYYGNATIIYPNVSIESDVSTFTINFTKNQSFISDINAHLVFNDTYYTATKTSDDNNTFFSVDVTTGLVSHLITNISFYWNYTITANETILNRTKEYNHSVYQMTITNCTGITANTTLNFTFFDIFNNNRIIATTSGVMSIWKSNPSVTRNATLRQTIGTESKFCIFPDFGYVNADYQFEFKNSSYNTQNYYIYSTILNSSSVSHKSIYFTNSSTSTEISVYIINNLNKGIYGVVVEAWMYDLATNSYTLSESKITDVDGLVKMNLYVTDKEYKFIAKIDGEIVYESDKMILYSTSYQFYVNLDTQEETPMSKLRKLSYSLIYNSTTRYVNVTWNDITSLGQKYYLESYKSNGTNESVISIQTSTSQTGRLGYLVPNSSGLWIVNFYVNSSDDNLKYYIDGVSIDKREASEIFGKESLVISIIFIGVITLIGIVISAEVGLILLAISLIIMYTLGFISLGDGVGLGLTALLSLIAVIIMFIVKLGKK